ncbi:hypothetical protein NIES2135_24450 [Leptolyngbya boryana NIES-2135]|jgi:hypothetical protein|uniref:Glycosyltransferase 61 catalytic domain-containing protein n=1 Tax=Leptolyngbya boryana NIES-2135 TaxID=1973484 RepID=A0A1Z4JFW2_LEPBY|nr:MULTISPECIES: glycosyltransferase family 61 protein [Leptolyngbya]BAY55621.1 hypothetical protein NIES2135_24450 [Leptolyngbya boryana NIES-2135]MBD2369979.1 glycosyltransferase family 61 protein [Leptolyngbya sp. FACHB-161]MBD2376319.1 glycosyltransferase family 61 protein [Leptolyngbya sp. FACHB-238]MBD2400594.1 glycosyltransferase family 61 protein [Leptolyngbya sp. FACHB-239]MBD2407136.1 glycosyltransferase family 61 protein [Leptolyngbya sp. FACHB-402]
MLNLALLNQRGLRLLTGRKTCEDLCVKQWTLSPSKKFFSPSAIYLDGELHKVTSVQEDTTYTAELQRVQEGVKEYAATIVYQLQDVTIYDGYMYKGAMKYPLTTAKESFFRSGELENIPEAALACTFVGNLYFGHWVRDDLTLTLAAQQFAQAVRTAQKLTNHQQEYSHLLNIHSTPVSKARIKELTIFEDFGQNQYKRERYEYIRSKFSSLSSHQTVEGVMLLRGNPRVQRLLVNENQIAEFLRNQGFIIVDPEKTSATEIVRQTLGAKIVVGVEGSQLAHGLFTLRESGAILTLQPPYRFNNVYKECADCLGLKYSFVVGKQVANGFEISLEDLARTLDMISARS